MNMNMKKQIGDSFFDIVKLEVNDNCCVIIPGPVIQEGHTPMVVELESHFNNIKAKVINFGEGCGKRFDVNMNIHGGAVITLYKFSFCGLVKQSLQSLDEEEPEETVDLQKITGRRSELSTIYSMARELDMKVSVSEYENYYEIGFRKSPKLATTPRKNVSRELNRWLLTLPYDEPTVPPALVMSDMSDVYIRTILNKSQFECSYSKGKITKLSYSLVNRGRGVEVRATGKTLARVESTKLSTLTENQRVHLNLQLMPHGIRVEGKGVIKL